MDTQQISAVARELYAARGARAIAEAAHQVEQSEKDGDAEKAKLWQRIEAALREIRGPLQG
jgi:hypothetical protein